MVVHRRSSRRGDLFSPALSRPNVLVRCLQPRLGGHCRRPVRIRCLVGGRGLSLDQPTRVVGCGKRPQGSFYLFGRSGCHTTAVAYLRRQGGTLSPVLNQGVHFFRKSCASQMSSFTKCLFLPRSRNSLGRFLENDFHQ